MVMANGMMVDDNLSCRVSIVMIVVKAIQFFIFRQSPFSAQLGSGDIISVIVIDIE